MADTSSLHVGVTANNSVGFNDKSLSELLDIIYLDTTPTVDDGICKIVSTRIRDKETSLAGVVEVLGSRLTSSHVLERSKAVEILAHVFSHLPVDFLNENELGFVVDFLCDRCKDQHMVIPKIIMCALPIVKCTHLPTGAGTKLLEQLFREANVQSHIHKIRHTFFKTLQCLLGKHLKELEEMTSDFVMNFLQSMDGEKDPRNLLLLFRIIPTIIGNFKLDPFIEDFFEILSCYFPIDFNPTVSVPGEEKIGRKDLAHALHICLSQTNEFSEFLLPLIMEKLESTSVDAKMDSLELLQMCCERSYTPQDLEPHLGNIWHAMRREIFMGGNNEVEKKCYEFLTAAFKMVSKDDSILTTCLAMIYSECKHHLSEPELRLIMPTASILRCISESGEMACNSVVQTLFPILYEQVCIKSTRSEKKRLLGIWETLISTCRQYKSIQLLSLVKWDEIRGLWFGLLTNDDWELVTAALKIFSHVIVNDADFPVEHRNMLQKHLLRLIKSSFTMPHDARSALVSLCCSLCHFYGEEFSIITVPRLLYTLSHIPSTSEDDSGGLCDSNCGEKMPCQVRSVSCRVLGDCSHLHPSVFEKVVSTLLEKLALNPLDLVCINCLGCIVEKACKTDADVYPKLDLLSHFTRLNIHGKIISVTYEICSLLKSGSGTTLRSIYDADGETTENVACWESIRQATCILRNIFRACNEIEQIVCVQKYWNDKVKESGEIEQQLQHIPGLLVEALLGSVRSSVEISFKKDLIHHILEKVLSDNKNAIKYEIFQEFHTMPFVRLLASFINKVIKEDDLEEYLKATETYVEKTLNGSYKDKRDVSSLRNSEQKIYDVEIQDKMGGCNTAQVKLINALAWIVKALAMRSYKGLELWVEKIIKLVRDETLGGEVVNCFPYLVADDSYSLNKESFCAIKLFYKQRLFLMVVDKLVSGYRTAQSQEIQFNFIRALSSQLKHVPSEILFMKIDSVLPLLVASLKCNSSTQVLLSTLTALMEMMQSPDTKHKLTEYCHDLVPQLTRLARHKESMDVRRESLSCLRKCARAPNHLILPLRDSVIDNLAPCLDDPKRLVRKEAALTKNIWTLIGAPGGL